MRIKRPKNTKKQGFIEFFVYPEKKQFVGICLTFDIVLEGKNPSKIMQGLQDAASLHIKTVKKNNLSDDLLNRYAPDEYWKKYFETLELLKRSRLEQKRLPEAKQLPYGPDFSRGLNPSFV